MNQNLNNGTNISQDPNYNMGSAQQGGGYNDANAPVGTDTANTGYGDPYNSGNPNMGDNTMNTSNMGDNTMNTSNMGDNTMNTSNMGDNTMNTSNMGDNTMNTSNMGDNTMNPSVDQTQSTENPPRGKTTADKIESLLEKFANKITGHRK